MFIKSYWTTSPLEGVIIIGVDKGWLLSHWLKWKLADGPKKKKKRVCVPSLSLSSGIFLSVSRTAGITWSYMCSSGLQLSEKLLWCSSSQCSSSKHSLSRDAAGLRHHGNEEPEHCGKGWGEPEGAVVWGTACYRDLSVHFHQSHAWEPDMWLTWWVWRLLRATKIQPLTMENNHHCLNHLRRRKRNLCWKSRDKVWCGCMKTQNRHLPQWSMDSCRGLCSSVLLSESSVCSTNEPPETQTQQWPT